MTLNTLLESGLKFAIVDDRLSVRGSAELVEEFRQMIANWKPELMKIAGGEVVADVGYCDGCNSDLIGLPTFDQFINRVCPLCGKWFRCLEPVKLVSPMEHQLSLNVASEYDDWTDAELIELWQERSAIMEHDRGLSAQNADEVSKQWFISLIGEKRFARIDGRFGDALRGGYCAIMRAVWCAVQED